ncbi:MAG: ion channel [Ferruginibacter sp.]
MALLRKISSKARTTANTGFGDNAASYGGRFLNKDGAANIHKTGLGILERFSWFHSMLAMKNAHFFIIILMFYVAVNLIFAAIYFFIGTEHLSGMQTHSNGQKFAEAFFFSAQTFTTVGYGRISPTGILTSGIAAFQALIGLLSFAVATGLMYGRFSKPVAYVKFSHNALIAPFKNGKGLMLRLAPFKNSILSEAEVRLTIGLVIEENGIVQNRFYPLDLELERVNTLNLSWTVVHPITENSPIYDFTREDFTNCKGEVIVFLKAFDDMFSNTVVARSSYTFGEIIYGAKFLPMFHQDQEHNRTVLDLDKLNDHKTMDLTA